MFFILQPFLEKYKKQLSITGGVVTAVFLYFFFIQDSSPNSTIETIDPLAFTTLDVPSTTPELEIQSNLEPEQIIIDVKGAVNYPGVYTLSENQRIIDAIEAAGGYHEEANPVLINHAQKLQDEMVIYIPKIGEDASEAQEQLVQISSANAPDSSNSTGKINLNKATESDLTQLPGIGPSKANAIIQHRTEHGNFKTSEDLKQVTGIGDKTFEQLKDLIDVK